ncbi:T9SS type A sorting domain-containing protein [Flammeovirga sp. SJP92]|uniref:T9SS type A sorting domain-containing protein n=1 Tax=Flammeovirga sp. SJP92 TaxID=1775430 RepID=UPI0007871FF3|nr:T9SS type A sorting domain-containing protein [Flammeovirga sp. SJP92]KXX70627.1 hypothetical protein AVL50_07335 [Flammeovirga sp. SJP92]
MKLRLLLFFLTISFGVQAQNKNIKYERRTEKDSLGNVWGYIDYVYDELNRVSEVKYRTSTEAISSRYTYTYTDDTILENYYRKDYPQPTGYFTYTGVKEDGSSINLLLDRIEALESRLSQLEGDNITSSTSTARKVTLFPNPTSTTFTIPNGFRFISINNHEGQKVAINSLSSYKKDISALPSGVYIVLLEDAEGRVYSEKVLKQ